MIAPNPPARQGSAGTLPVRAAGSCRSCLVPVRGAGEALDLFLSDQLAHSHPRAVGGFPFPSGGCGDDARPERPGPALSRTRFVGPAPQPALEEHAAPVGPLAQAQPGIDASGAPREKPGRIHPEPGGDRCHLLALEPDIPRRSCAAGAAPLATEAQPGAIPGDRAQESLSSTSSWREKKLLASVRAVRTSGAFWISFQRQCPNL